MKYISDVNANEIRNLLQVCEQVAGGDIIFKVYDTESLVYKGKSIDALLDALDGGDEEVGINVYAVNGKTYLGWFGVLPYECDGEWLMDCSDNEFCDSVYKLAGF